MSQISQLLYSQDLAVSDFYLFATVWDWFERIHAVDADDLLKQLLEILQEIPVDKLERVCTTWPDRVSEVSEKNDDYTA
jgi:hypothetical protein